MHFFFILLAIALFIYWKFFRPRQLEVFIIAILTTFATMTLVAIVLDDIKLGFLFAFSLPLWGKVFDHLFKQPHLNITKKINRFLGKRER